jgi:hypothetical protein
MDERAKLLLLTDIAGPVFGTEQFCLFLYSLARMHEPRIIVELGTGLGVSAFWMALAAKLNGHGHVWTVDDLEYFEQNTTLLKKICSELDRMGFGSVNCGTPKEYLEGVAKLLQIDNQLTFINTRIDLNEARHFEQYPFGDQPIDLLFSDFKHGPAAVLAILGHFLPRMSPSSSIFIDSAATYWPSFLLLENLVTQLNHGKVAKLLQDRTSVDLSHLVRNLRIVLVHLTEAKTRNQNSAVWLKIEPIDVVPQPRAYMR